MTKSSVYPGTLSKFKGLASWPSSFTRSLTLEGSFPHAVNCILGDRSLMLHEWTFPQLCAERGDTPVKSPTPVSA